MSLHLSRDILYMSLSWAAFDESSLLRSHHLVAFPSFPGPDSGTGSAVRARLRSSMFSRFCCFNIFLVRPRGNRFSQPVISNILVCIATSKSAIVLGRPRAGGNPKVLLTVHTIRTQQMGSLHPAACRASVEIGQVLEAFAGHEPLSLLPM